MKDLAAMTTPELWRELGAARSPDDRSPIIALLKQRGQYSYTDDMTSRLPAYMTTFELREALEAEPEGTDQWGRLCREAYQRVARGAFPRHRVPATFDPSITP